MRKIFTFICAALMSAGMWALTPQGSDAWDDATKTLTVNSNPDDYAYYGESDIENLVISDAVTSIGESAFANCSGLTSIEVASGNTTYDSRDNCNAIIETSSNTLIQGCQNTIIPNSVTSIGDEAFSGCTGLTSVTIGNSVTSIGQSAFAGCEGLTSITIPNSVTSIGGSAFIGCSGLTSVTIGNSVTSIGDYAFYRCSALTSVTINAESLESYGSGAFDDTHADLTIYVPAGSVDTYKAAENWADYAAKIVAIPGGGSSNSCGDGLTWEFNDKVLAISFDGEGTGAMDNWDSENPAPWYDDAPDIKYVEIAEGVTSIGAYAFADCDFFFIDLPATVTSIGENAFSNIAGHGITILSTECTLPQDLLENGNFEYIFVPAASVATYQDQYQAYDYLFAEIPSVKKTDNVILWDLNLCTSIMAGSPRDELEILNYHNTQGGITVTAEVDYMHGDVEAGFMYGGIVFECSGKLIFTSAVGNITHIEISGDRYDDPEIAGWTWTPGEGGDNGTLSWTGDAASVELPITQSTTLENTEIEFTLEGGATAIENTAVDTKAVKRIVNGQLLIEKNGKIYNAIGAEVR